MGNVSTSEICDLVGCSREVKDPGPSYISETRRGIPIAPTKPTVVWNSNPCGNFGFNNPRATLQDQRPSEAEGRSKAVDLNEHLHNAAESGNVSDLSHIIAHGADRVEINSSDIHGNTALHKAAFQGHLDACTLLCKHGALATQPNHYSLTPFDIAIKRGHIACAKAMKTATDAGDESVSPSRTLRPQVPMKSFTSSI